MGGGGSGNSTSTDNTISITNTEVDSLIRYEKVRLSESCKGVPGSQCTLQISLVKVKPTTLFSP
jgi:hypothetical protein